jgi:hypothetical protein
MLTSLEWQTLEQQRRISRLVMMYKIQHQLLDIDRDLYLVPGDFGVVYHIRASALTPQLIAVRHLGFPIGIENRSFVEYLPMIITGQFGFNCPSGFREEAF